MTHIWDISELEQTSSDLKKVCGKLERRVLEKSRHLEDADSLFEGTSSSLPEVVLVIDPVTRNIISCNRAVEKIFGYTKEEVIGHNIEILHVDHDHYVQFKNKVLPMMMNEGVFSTEFKLKKKNGEIFPTENTVTGIRDEMGRLTGLVSVVRDITERKKVLESLGQSKKALRILAGSLISSQEEERSRLARELHDDYVQRLAVVAVLLGKLEQGLPFSSKPVYKQMQEIREQVVKLSTDLHGISCRLHPSILDDLGVNAAIESECAAFSEREEIQIEYESNGLPPTLSKGAALCIYRIVQEGLRNIAKHANTKKACVRLTGSDDLIVLSIQDHGIGFDTAEIKKRGSLGLVSMKERIRLLKGKLSIQSQPGQGTLIEVRLSLIGRIDEPELYIIGRRSSVIC